MAIESVIKAYRYEDFAFTFDHADQTALTGLDLIFEILDAWDGTPLISRTVGSGITLSLTVLYRATVTLTSASLGIAASDSRVWTISKRNAGLKRVLSYGTFVLHEPRVGRD